MKCLNCNSELVIPSDAINDQKLVCSCGFLYYVRKVRLLEDPEPKEPKYQFNLIHYKDSE
jgi:hypothetical protein